MRAPPDRFLVRAGPEGAGMVPLRISSLVWQIGATYRVVPPTVDAEAILAMRWVSIYR